LHYRPGRLSWASGFPQNLCVFPFAIFFFSFERWVLLSPLQYYFFPSLWLVRALFFVESPSVSESPPIHLSRTRFLFDDECTFPSTFLFFGSTFLCPFLFYFFIKERYRLSTQRSSGFLQKLGDASVRVSRPQCTACGLSFRPPKFIFRNFCTFRSFFKVPCTPLLRHFFSVPTFRRPYSERTGFWCHHFRAVAKHLVFLSAFYHLSPPSPPMHPPTARTKIVFQAESSDHSPEFTAKSHEGLPLCGQPSSSLPIPPLRIDVFLSVVESGLY